MRPCFAFTNVLAAENKPATLSIYDEIGFWGVQAKDFRDSLEKVASKELTVEINSPGGDVYAGLAIYNMLKASGKTIKVMVMGVAASAASLIAMAGDTIVMPKNTFMMVHNPWTFAMGNADELRETAEVLDKIGTSLRATYAARTGLSDEDLEPLLAKDTWLTADEAVEKGFADEVVDSIEAKAMFSMDRADLPEHVKGVFAAKPKTETDPEPDPAAETDEPPLASQIDAYSKMVGMEKYAAAWALACTTLDEAKARAKTATEIVALCKVTNKADLADAAIRANKSYADVRKELADAMAAADEAAPTNGVRKSEPTSNSGQKAGSTENPPVSSTSLWDSHHKQSAKERK